MAPEIKNPRSDLPRPAPAGSESDPSADTLEAEDATPEAALLRDLVRAMVREPAPIELLSADRVRGAQVDRYLLLEQLGRGGMGLVFSAYDPKLNRKVALKFLRTAASGSDPRDAKARLLREAQAIARLAHPNVVGVYDAGTYQGQVYLAMELVEGVTLAQWLAPGPPLAERLQMFVQAGQGLRAAHAAGLIHRDFKPDNVLIGNDGRARVADFGLARATGEREPPAPRAPPAQAGEGEATVDFLGADLTRTGARVGTPAYMAPEQRAGAEVDARSDQYSFCVALYEALHGRRPSESPAPSPRASAARVPAGIDAALARGLSTRPEDRFPSMDALLQALEGHARRNRRRWFVAAAGMALAGAGVLVYRERVLGARQCQGAEQSLQGVWDGPRREDVRAAFLATGKPFAEDALRGVERSLDGRAQALSAMRTEACAATRLRGEQSEELFDLRMDCLARRLQETRALVDLFTRADGQIVQNAADAAQGLTAIEGCANVAALRAPLPLPAAPPTRDQIAEVRSTLATVKALTEAARWDEGRPLAAAAVQKARAIGYAPLEAEALHGQAMVLDRKDAYLPMMDDALIKAVQGRHDAEVVEILLDLIFDLQDTPPELDRAALLSREVFAWLERIGGGGLLEVKAWHRAGVIQWHLGHHDLALEDGQRALGILMKLPDAPPRYASFVHDLIGLALRGQGRLEESVAAEQRALAKVVEAVGPRHPQYAYALINQARALADLGRLDEASALLSRAIGILEGVFGTDHQDVGVGNLELAAVLRRQKKYGEALVRAQRVLAIAGKIQHRRLEANALRDIGEALLDREEPDQALPPLERGLQIRIAEPAPLRLGEMRFLLARALWTCRKPDRPRARTLLQQARLDLTAAGVDGRARLGELEAWQRERR